MITRALHSIDTRRLLAGVWLVFGLMLGSLGAATAGERTLTGIDGAVSVAPRQAPDPAPDGSADDLASFEEARWDTHAIVAQADLPLGRTAACMRLSAAAHRALGPVPQALPFEPPRL